MVDNRVRTEGVLRERRLQVDDRGMSWRSRLLTRREAWRGFCGSSPTAGVNIEYAYSGVGEGIARATIVLGVDDPMRAATRGWRAS